MIYCTWIVASLLLLSPPKTQGRLSGRRPRDEAPLEIFDKDADKEMIDVVIRYKDDGIDLKHRLSQNQRNQVRRQFKKAKAVSLSIPRSELSLLERDSSVASVQRDYRMYPLSEKVPWGIEAVQGRAPSIPLPSKDQANGEPCFKICVVDSGVYLGHEDIPYNLHSSEVSGMEFGLPDGQHWYDPEISDHGTHVTGTIIAAKNGIGVVGVIPDSQGICMMHARVFPDDEFAGQLTSEIDAGVEWCVENGARVVNLSLGSSLKDDTTEEIYKKLVEEDDVLLIAAAGNNGGGNYSYPAAFDFVMGVAAIDSNQSRASFSQHNDQVDITAPGDSIVSTVPGLQLVDGDKNGYSVIPMDYSVTPKTSFKGDLFFCGLGQNGECSGANGKVCLIERGNNTFADKAITCKAAGGIAGIVYNNDDEMYTGTLASEVVDIPIFSMSRAEGETLKLRASGGKRAVKFDLDHGSYNKMSGTSMATPHVAGVAAKIWAALPHATSAQVREALEQTALDLQGNINRNDALGRDDSFGYGLVQAVEAYNYLLEHAGPPSSPSLSSPTSPTSPPVTTGDGAATAWRIEAPRSTTGRIWDVVELQLYSASNCQTGSLIHPQEGTPIDSSHHEDFPPSNAFDSNDDMLWGGRPDPEHKDALWLGKTFGEAVNVECLIVRQRSPRNAVELLVQKSNNGGSSWETVWKASGLDPKTESNKITGW